MSGLTAVKKGILLVFFIGAAWADVREMRIPNRLLSLAWLLRIPVFLAEWAIAGREGAVLAGREALESMVWMAVLAVLAAVTAHGIGFGDVKLLGTAVLYQGIEKSLAGFLVGIILAGGAAAVLLMLGRIGHRDKLPLAPFFLLGYGAVLLGRSCGIAV